MKTNKFDINDLVSICISDAEQATGRITEIQLFEGEILYHADLDKSMSGWYAENDFVLLANCELDADYYGPSPVEELIELSKEMGEPRIVAMPLDTTISPTENLERPKFNLSEAYSKMWQKALEHDHWDGMVYSTGVFTVPVPQIAKRTGYSVIKVDTLGSGCNHQWVDVGFMQSKIVCKHCNKEQDS